MFFKTDFDEVSDLLTKSNGKPTPVNRNWNTHSLLLLF
jgi:hypothetical protein